ncbi:8-amino-7-oxononanoate synthase [Minicystis rosea]|nr:8-amino-7-oxononanoate synthase [Minicystis rosea]
MPNPLDPLRHLQGDLEALEREGLLRAPLTGPTEGLLDLCSNDYLGYAGDPWPALNGRSGAGASRLVSGNRAAHSQAEAAIADWLGSEAALLFSSGYAANVGAIGALTGPGDVIISDALNHASIIDGCRLSGAQVRVVPHLDIDAVRRALADATQARRRWVVTESYFSMDGDTPDLSALESLCRTHDAALVVDEAHALGVFGPEGRGLCAASGVKPDVLIGAAGKALGLHGAFVSGSKALRLWLWNRARSFVFSTGISPALALAICSRVERIRSDDEGRLRIADRSSRLRGALAELGHPSVLAGRGPVIPLVIGEPAAAVSVSSRLRTEGVLVQAIRPPTVPRGTARLRITACASLTEADLDRAVQAFRAALKKCG